MKEFSWSTFDRIITVLGMLGFIKICTVNLSFKDYGILSIYLSLIQITIMICSAPTASAIGRYFPVAYRRNHLNYFYKAFIKTFINSIKYSIILLSVLIIFNSQIIYISPLSIILIITLVIEKVIYDFLKTISESTRKRKPGAIAELVYFISVFLLIYLIPKDYLSSIESITFSVCLATLISIIVLIMIFPISPKGIINTPLEISLRNKLTKAYTNSFVAYTVPIIVLSIASIAQQQVGKFALAAYVDEFHSGVFSFMSSISYAPFLHLAGVSVSFFGPILNSRLIKFKSLDQKKNNANLTLYAASIYIILSIILVILIGYFSDTIFQLLAPQMPEYKYSKYLPIFAISGSLMGLSTLFSCYLMNILEVRILSIYLTPTIVFTSITLMLTLIRPYGIVGAIYSQLVLSSIYCCITYFLFIKTKHIKNEKV